MEANAGLDAQKKELRRLIRSQLLQISPAAWRERSVQLANRLQTLLQVQLQLNADAEYLGVYAPRPDEVRWQESRALAQAKLAFPGIDGSGTMIFQHAQWEDLLPQVSFGSSLVAGPPPAAPRVVPRICVIPGLAFTSSGKRLGRGKGFYDRYLSSQVCIKVGLCLADFCLSDIPTHVHDQNMDWVVTDRDVFQVVAI